MIAFFTGRIILTWMNVLIVKKIDGNQLISRSHMPKSGDEKPKILLSCGKVAAHV